MKADYEARPDYKFWETKEQFDLRVAAWLCCDQEPRPDEVPPTMDVLTMARKLVLTANPEYPEGEPLLRPTTVEQIWQEHAGASFTRKGLREWSEKTGQQHMMPFLFPETVVTEDIPKGEECATAYRIIRALACALADAYPETLKKDGAPFVGYSKPTGEKGIVGYLMTEKYTTLKNTALGKHIGHALKHF